MPPRRLTDEQVTIIRKLFNPRIVTFSALAKRFGVNSGTVIAAYDGTGAYAEVRSEKNG